jgi:hypothetical protein
MIELKGIVAERRPCLGRREPELCAQVAIETGGSIVHGAPQAIAVGVNEFKLFKTGRDVDIDAAMAYSAVLGDDRLKLLAVYVEHINEHANTVQVAVFVASLGFSF